MSTFRTLDTYEADLLNEQPPRREQVTEIQDAETGELLCYASQANAELIVRAINSFEASRTAMRDAIESLTRLRDGRGGAYAESCIQQLQKALGEDVKPQSITERLANNTGHQD